MASKQTVSSYYNNRRDYYRYYDTPEGKDIPKKIMCCARYGITGGLLISLYDVLMYSHAVGMGNILRRCVFHTVPWGLMGATFAAVANTLQNVREKNDALNYFLGGFACGPIVAAYTGSGHGLVAGGIVLGIGAMIKKEAVDRNATIYPMVKQMGMIDSWRNDFTLSEDPRDEWYHTCEEKKPKDK